MELTALLTVRFPSPQNFPPSHFEAIWRPPKEHTCPLYSRRHTGAVPCPRRPRARPPSPHRPPAPRAPSGAAAPPTPPRDPRPTLPPHPALASAAPLPHCYHSMGAADWTNKLASRGIKTPLDPGARASQPCFLPPPFRGRDIKFVETKSGSQNTPYVRYKKSSIRIPYVRKCPSSPVGVSSRSPPLPYYRRPPRRSPVVPPPPPSDGPDAMTQPFALTLLLPPPPAIRPRPCRSSASNPPNRALNAPSARSALKLPLHKGRGGAGRVLPFPIHFFLFAQAPGGGA